MEMCYDGALVMPNNFDIVNEGEMEYIDGGWAVEKNWWGINVYFTNEERMALTSGQICATAILSKADPVAGIIAGAATSLIWNYDVGYGVRLRYVGWQCTGIFSLSASQEKNIAKKNRVI